MHNESSTATSTAPLDQANWIYVAQYLDNQSNTSLLLICTFGGLFVAGLSYLLEWFLKKMHVWQYVIALVDKVGSYIPNPFSLEYTICSLIIRPTSPKLSRCKIVTGPQRRNETCSHCWDTLQADDSWVIVHKACNNGWHLHCLQEWVKSRRHGTETCPICFTGLTESADFISPDGDRGHTWRPAALHLALCRSAVICICIGIGMISVEGVPKLLGFVGRAANELSTSPKFDSAIRVLIYQYFLHAYALMWAVTTDILLMYTLLIRIPRHQYLRNMILLLSFVLETPTTRLVVYLRGIQTSDLPGFDSPLVLVVPLTIIGIVRAYSIMTKSGAWMPKMSVFPFLV